MSKTEEHFYHEGFLDGQQSVYDMWIEVIDITDGRTEAFEEFARRMNELKQEIDSV